MMEDAVANRRIVTTIAGRTSVTRSRAQHAVFIAALSPSFVRAPRALLAAMSGSARNRTTL
jgi:hypothetical protein